MIHILLTGLVLSLLAGPSFAVPVKVCDTKVPAGQTGELQNDLYCDDTIHAVELLDDATLNLNGYSITGTFLPWPRDERLPGTVIECDGDCTVVGPGEIFGAIGPGVFPDFGEGATAIGFGRSSARVRVVVNDVTIRACGDAMVGYRASKGRSHAWVTLTDVTLIDNTGVGIAFVDTLDATNVTADHNLIGLTARVLRGTNLHASDNTFAGIGASRIAIDGLVAHGNGLTGVSGGLITLANATVTGNTWFGTPLDIQAARRPHLTTSTCTRSQRSNTGLLSKTWKVCTDD